MRYCRVVVATAVAVAVIVAPVSGFCRLPLLLILFPSSISKTTRLLFHPYLTEA